MFMHSKSQLLAIALALGICILLSTGSAEEHIPSETRDSSNSSETQNAVRRPNLALPTARNDIRKKLKTKISIDFKEIPLHKVFATLARRGGIPIHLDKPEIQEEGISVNETITITLNNVTIEQALDVILESIGLASMIRDEVLIVTTFVPTEEHYPARTYDVKGLEPFVCNRLDKREHSDHVCGDGSLLMALIIEHTYGMWKVEFNQGGTLNCTNQVLIAQSTKRDHQEIDSLIHSMRLCLRTDMRGRSVAARHLNFPIEENYRIEKALRRKSSFHFKLTPLNKIAAELERRFGIPIRIDSEGLAEEELSPKQLVSFQFNDISLASALRLILEPFGLTAFINRGFLEITTIIKSEDPANYYIMVHNVRDLEEAGITGRQISDTILNCTNGSWAVESNPGRISGPIHGLLFVTECERVHQDCLRVLDQLRRRIEPVEQRKRDQESSNAYVTQFYPTIDPARAISAAKTIKSLVAPNSWDTDEQATIHVVGRTIVIRQSRRVHQQVTLFLEQLSDAERSAINNGGV